jgi:hypothetical protein
MVVSVMMMTLQPTLYTFLLQDHHGMDYTLLMLYISVERQLDAHRHLDRRQLSAKLRFLLTLAPVILATEIVLKRGRVVLIRLHEPVKFTPGAIAQRVFGGTIQEMQLFPTQRFAIIVFLHPAEAKVFLRRVKNTYMHERAEDIPRAAK